jgi:hypothetical protein
MMSLWCEAGELLKRRPGDALRSVEMSDKSAGKRRCILCKTRTQACAEHLRCADRSEGAEKDTTCSG